MKNATAVGRSCRPIHMSSQYVSVRASGRACGAVHGGRGFQRRAMAFVGAAACVGGYFGIPAHCLYANEEWRAGGPM